MSLSQPKRETSGQTLADLPPHVASPDPSVYWSDNYVVLDFETTSLLKGSALAEGNRIVLACWSGESMGVESTRASEYEQERLVKAVTRADFIVAHNAKFELQWLKRCGLDLHNLLTFDTMIAEYVLGGNRFRPQHLGLDATLSRRGMHGKGNTVSKMIKAGIPVESIPEEWLLRYCVRDVEATHELFVLQREELRAQSLEQINYARNLVTPALADIEFNGMQLDEEAVFKLEEETEKEYAALTTKMQDFCEGADPGSPKQMASFIFESLGFVVPRDFRGQPMLTNTGGYSAREEVMDRLRPKGARQRRFLDLYGRWKRCNTDLTKGVRKFADCCREAGGKLYASFNQCSTRTHRFSSSGLTYKVQFQNFSRKFKPLFRARKPGWAVGEADGAQLEFRVAAHLGRDNVALSDIVQEVDIHRRTASILNSIEEHSVTKDQRQGAKEHTFKPLYAGQSGTPAQKRYYASFRDRYKGIFNTQTSWTHDVLRDKRLVTEWGMKYYWPDTKTTQTGYITNSTSIFNYPVQALATAELIPISLVCAWHRGQHLKSFFVNTVHDSIIGEVAEEERSTWEQLCRISFIDDTYTLINQLYGVALTVPLATEVSTGARWGKPETSIEFSAEPELWMEAAQKEGMI